MAAVNTVELLTLCSFEKFWNPVENLPSYEVVRQTEQTSCTNRPPNDLKSRKVLSQEKISGNELSCQVKMHYGYAQSWFAFVSTIADLRTTFLFFFPIWFHLQTAVGVKLVWVAVVGDWLNLVLKWLMFGERPYWWVQETVYYGNLTVPQIKQFPMTCETGPGSPSGHTMGAAGVYYAMVTSLLPILQDSNPTKRWCLQGLLWTLFWGVQLCVSLSRVFNAAHFPHQVIAGVVTGIAVAKAFNRVSWIYSASLKSYMQTILCLLSVALGLYGLLDAASIDPYWSVIKAQKWCNQSEWVHLDTTPFAGLLRSTGTLFGLGLSLHLPIYGDWEKNKSCGTSVIYRLTCTAATLSLLSLLDSFRLPTNTHSLFYLLTFCKSATVPLATISVVPYCMSTLANIYQRIKVHLAQKNTTCSFT